jgi:hypothetical protein
VVTNASSGSISIYGQNAGPVACGLPEGYSVSYDDFCSQDDSTNFDTISAALWAQLSSFNCH